MINQNEWKRYQDSKERHKEYGEMNRTDYERILAKEQRGRTACKIGAIAIYVVLAMGALALILNYFLSS